MDFNIAETGFCLCWIAGWLDILMVIALCALLMAGYPVAFSLAGVALVFATLGLTFGVFDVSYLQPFPLRIFGSITNTTLIAVPMFILMGVILEKSKIAEELLEEMAKLFGSLRGGLGISVTIVGALLAASTGIVGATVVTMGLLSLPTMLRRGYEPAFASGSIAAAGTLGQIIPPSIVLILLGDVISNAYQKAQLEQGVFAPETVSVGDLFAGALLPGLMLVGMYLAWQVVVAVTQTGESARDPGWRNGLSQGSLAGRSQGSAAAASFNCRGSWLHPRRRCDPDGSGKRRRHGRAPDRRRAPCAQKVRSLPDAPPYSHRPPQSLV